MRVWPMFKLTTIKHCIHRNQVEYNNDLNCRRSLLVIALNFTIEVIHFPEKTPNERWWHDVHSEYV